MINTTLCYIYDRINNNWLMLYRNKKNCDVNKGKWIGVGGKVEKNETIRECMVREILEETGLTALELDYCGVIYFTYDTKDSEKIYVYTCSNFTGNVIDCNEGTLEWIPHDKVLNLPLWDGDKLFLKKILSFDKNVFCFDFHYDSNGKLIEVHELEGEVE